MGASFKTLVCRIETQRTALVLEKIEEVVPVAKLSPLPGSPAWVAGVLDLRGRMVPVIDTAMRLFERPRQRRRLSDLIVICSVSNEVAAGLLVDFVEEVEEVERAALQVPGDGHLPYEPYVLAMYPVEGESTVLLCPETLIAASGIQREPYAP